MQLKRLLALMGALHVFILAPSIHAQSWLCDRSQLHGTFIVSSPCNVTALASDEEGVDNAVRIFKPPSIHDIGKGNAAGPTGTLSLMGPSHDARGLVTLDASSFAKGVTLFALYDNDDALIVTNLIVQAYSRNQIWSERLVYLRFADVRATGTVTATNVTFSGFTNAILSIARGSTSNLNGCRFFWNKRGKGNHGGENLNYRGSVIYGGNDQESSSLAETHVSIVRSIFEENMHTAIHTAGVKARIYIDESSFLGATSRPSNVIGNDVAPFGAININDPQSNVETPSLYPDHLEVRNSNFSHFYALTHHRGVLSSVRGTGIVMKIHGCRFELNSQRANVLTGHAAAIMFGASAKGWSPIGGVLHIEASVFLENAADGDATVVLVQTNGLMHTNVSIVDTDFENNGRGSDPFDPSKTLKTTTASAIFIHPHDESTPDQTTAIVQRCTFRNNQGVYNNQGHEAGAFVIAGPANVIVASSSFINNIGGAIVVALNNYVIPIVLEIRASLFLANTAKTKAGGVSFPLSVKSLHAKQCRYTLHLIGNTFRQNQGEKYGGALHLLYTEHSAILMEANTFDGNVCGTGTAATSQRGRDLYLLYLPMINSNQYEYEYDPWERCTPTSTSCMNNADCHSGRCQGTCSADSHTSMVAKRCQGSTNSSHDHCDVFRRYSYGDVSATHGKVTTNRDGRCESKFCCKENRNNIIIRDSNVHDSSYGRCNGIDHDTSDLCWKSSIFGELQLFGTYLPMLQSNADVSLPRTCQEDACGNNGATSCLSRTDNIDEWGVHCQGCEWVESATCYVCNPDLSLSLLVAPVAVSSTDLAVFHITMSFPQRWNYAQCQSLGKSVQYQVDGGVWMDHDGRKSNDGFLVLVLDQISEGKHTLLVRAMDPALQSSSWAIPELKHVWTVDLTHPVAVVAPVVGSSFESTNPYTKESSIMVELGSNEPGSGLEWEVDSVNNNWVCTVPTVLGCSTAAVAIDAENGTVQMNVKKPNAGTTAAFGVSEGEATRISTCMCMIGAKSATTKATIHVLEEGRHVLKVFAQDFASDGNGNRQPTPTLFTWFVDTTPPVATLGPVVLTDASSRDACSQVTSWGDNQVTRHGNASVSFLAINNCTFDDASFCSPLSNFVWKHTHNAATISFNRISTDGVVELDGLTHGTHIVSCFATDSAFNEGNVVKYQWMVDQRAPVAKFSLNGQPRQLAAGTRNQDGTASGALVLGFEIECWDESGLFKESGCKFQYALIHEFAVANQATGPTAAQINSFWNEQVYTNDQDSHDVIHAVGSDGSWWVAVRAIDKSGNVQANSNSIPMNLMRVEIVRSESEMTSFVLSETIAPATEGSTRHYTMKLSNPIVTGTTVKISVFSQTTAICVVSSLPIVTLTEHRFDVDTTVVAIRDNFVDEDTNAATCEITHVVINSTDSNFTVGTEISSFITILNDDAADVVVLQNIGDRKIPLKVKNLAIMEGQEKQILLQLTSEPVVDVLIKMKKIDRATNGPVSAMGPPVVMFSGGTGARPDLWLFTKLNWNISQPLIVTAKQDDVSNDMDEEEIEIHLMTSTKDEQYKKVEDVIVLIAVPEEDEAGVLFFHEDRTAYISLKEGFENLTVSQFQLKTIPTAAVNFAISSDDPNVLVSFSDSKNPTHVLRVETNIETNRLMSEKMRPIKHTIYLRAMDGALDTSTLTLTASSADPRYHNTYKTSVAVTQKVTKTASLRMTQVSVSLPAPNRQVVAKPQLLVNWKAPDDLAHDLTVEWSPRRQFDIDVSSVTLTNTQVTSVIIETSKPIPHEVVYARIRIEGQEYSDPSIETWVTVRSCKESTEYLDINDPKIMSWHCIPCPSGAYCNKISTSLGLPPLLNYWQVPWTMDKDKIGRFEKCPSSINCMGVRPEAFNSSSFNASASPCNKGIVPDSIVCAVCAEGFTKTGGPNGQCTSCQAATMVSQMVVLIIAFVIVLFLGGCVCFNKKKIKKYKSAYGTVIKLFNIAVSLIQVNSSLVNVNANVKWPSSLIQFYDLFDIFNFEVTTIVGGSCVSPLLGSFVLKYLVSFLPVICILVVTGCRLLAVKATKYKKKNEGDNNEDDNDAMVRVAENIFDLFDDNQSGSIDCGELVTLLKDLGIKDTTEEKCRAVLINVKTNKELNDQEVTLSRSNFVQALIQGQLPGVDVEAVQQLRNTTELQKRKSSVLSSSLQLLALLHTPVSRSTFSYFQCHHIFGHEFMRTDYKIACWTSSEWLSFLPVVVIVLIGFTMLMPLSIGAYLFCKRKQLYTVRVQHQIGFLYEGFTKHAEWWLVHEMLRKLFLTGFLVLIPAVLRSPFGILVSLVALINLNYFKPHRSPLVFAVAQGSFLITAITFCMSSVFNFNNRDETNEADVHNVELVAALIVAINVLFFTVTLGSMVFIVIVLKRKVAAINQKHPTKVAPVNGGESVS